jgi:hypothetical protein
LAIVESNFEVNDTSKNMTPINLATSISSLHSAIVEIII